MLDNTGTRQLCYVVKIDDIKPILGSDNCECAVVNGWTVLVRKGTFEKNSLAIYFEIDSHVDINKPEFAFLEKKHGNIKTQKYSFGRKNPGFYSQGLLMTAEDFGWNKTDLHEGDFLTERLGVTYAVAEDNARKAKSNPDAKINAALARHPKFAKKYGKIIKKNKFLRWFFTLVWGKKKDSRSWPSHIAAKTDVERIQNMVWILNDKHPYVATEKIDGSSCSIMAERTKFGRIKYYICSRNVEIGRAHV